MVRLIKVPDYQQLSVVAAQYIQSLLAKTWQANISLTTGNTPVGTYNELVKLAQSGQVDLNQCRIFSTEEYYGVGPNDRCSLYGWLRRCIIEPAQMPDDRIVRLKGELADAHVACLEFREAIRAYGGLDLVVESIGVNAHIGFNEPDSTHESVTRLVRLTAETQASNEQYWNTSVPSQGLTIGLSEILAAKHILLLASGRHKAEAVRKLLLSPEVPSVPASYLRRSMNLTVMADEDALSLVDHCERGEVVG